MITPVCLAFLFFTCAITGDVYNGRTADVYNNWPHVNTRFVVQKREALMNSDNATLVKIPITDTTQKGLNETNIVQKNDNPKNDLPETKQEASHDGLTEGGGQLNINQEPSSTKVTNNTQIQSNVTTVDTSKGNNTKANETVITQKITSPTTNNTITSKSSEAENAVETSPGVVKRGLIVFGGFALMAVAYFIFYRKKNKKYDSSNMHNSNDTNQFRYGVLQSEDRRDNLELSRIPLTMESDEDEDDLEIFDLEQKKKSLSYVNLQGNDEDIVLNSSKDESKNNLLLDIEDGPSDTLINWSSNSSKSIL